nr:IS1 family transposase [Serratia sp. JSRIV002]
MSGAKAMSDGYYMLTVASENELLHMRLCPRNAQTLKRLLVLLSLFKITFFMTNAWPVHQTLLASTSHVVSKMNTLRIERHNLNLRPHLKRLARKTI